MPMDNNSGQLNQLMLMIGAIAVVGFICVAGASIGVLRGLYYARTVLGWSWSTFLKLGVLCCVGLCVWDCRDRQRYKREGR